MNTHKITPDDVSQFLKDNPDFLVKNEELLSHLTPPSAHDNKGVVDFQHFMLNRLKNDKERAVKDRKALIEVSRTNMSILNRIHEGVLRLLDSRSLEELLETIITELPLIVDVDMIALIMEADKFEVPHHYSNGIRLAEKGVLSVLIGDKSYVLQANIVNQNFVASLYGKSAATLIKSHALIRLELLPQSSPTVIAFASRNPTLFDDNQGTELLRFLAMVIERTLRLWLIR